MVVKNKTNYCLTKRTDFATKDHSVVTSVLTLGTYLPDRAGINVGWRGCHRDSNNLGCVCPYRAANILPAPPPS